MITLTPRQRQIIALIADDHSRKMAAAKLGLSIGTVNRHLEILFARLEVHSASAAVAKVAFIEGAHHWGRR